MTVTDLRGRRVAWNPRGKKLAKCSGPHLRARSLLSEMFPAYNILEEVGIPNSNLRFDFLIPRRNLVVEVDGRQHGEFSPHFHGTVAAYAQARRNDADKEQFCETNGLTLVRLIDSESDLEWRERLLEV